MALAVFIGLAALVFYETGSVRETTKATMESWMVNVHNAELHRPLLAANVHMVVVSNDTANPEALKGADKVIDFYKRYGFAKAREFMSVDGSAFAVEMEMPSKIGVSVLEADTEGKISSIRTWSGEASSVAKSEKKTKQQKHEALMAVLRDAITVASRADSTVCTEHYESPSKMSDEQKERFANLTKKVAALNFEPVIARLAMKGEYEAAEAKAAVDEYQKFLVLLGMGTHAVPSEKVDDAWHAHILYTQKYQRDCEEIFGHMIHHEPANLLLEQDGAQQQKISMIALYNETQQQLCNYYGAIDTSIWSQESVAHCHCHCHCHCHR